MSQFRSIIGATSTLGVPSTRNENIIYEPNIYNITPGEDFVVFDTYDKKYKCLRRSTYIPEKFNDDRYNTNYDIVLGIYGNTLRAISTSDTTDLPNIVGDNTAAAFSYYRLEIDTTTAGNLTCIVKPSNELSINITWNANDSMSVILQQFLTQQQATSGDAFKVYTQFNILKDGKGIGVAVGYYGSNSCTITNVTGNVNLIDMSQFAIYSNTIKYNDNYNPDLPVLDNKFKNWRGNSSQNILGKTLIPVNTHGNCIANNDLNYQNRCGINFAGWKSWASTQNDTKNFVSDGVNGSTLNGSNIMKRTLFDEYVNENATIDSDGYKMYVYYNNLLTSSDQFFKEKHDLYVAKYGDMTDLYDAYLMSHMVNTDKPTSGILSIIKDFGLILTQNKGKIFTVTYDYKYYPAYPPEYNALQYGLEDNNRGFGKGTYYHPEPYDLAIMLRDDMMEKLNNNFIEGNFSIKLLDNNTNLGSCAEYNSTNTWYFDNRTKCLNSYSQYWSNFKTRPIFGFKIN